MKKSLISLAVAAAVAAPVAAFADSNVVVYGVANVSADSVSQNKTNAAGTKFKISSNTSRLGFKGNEDLGDGLSAIWQVESLINIDNSGAGNGFATRNTFAGLSSASLGTVIMGRHDTPYKIATRAYDVFGDGIADNRSLMGGVSGRSAAASFDGRQTDVIAYISPAMGGFTGIAGFVQLNEIPGPAKANAISLAGMYNGGAELPLTASLSYEEHILDGIARFAGAKESSVKAGASYAIDALTLAAVYETSTDNLGALKVNAFGHKAGYLSAKYAIGMGAVKAAYGQAGATAVAQGAKQWTLGYDHGLSKRTTVYGLYTKLSNNGNGITAGAYGLSTNGTGASNTAGNLGSAPSAFSLGVKHSF